MHLYQKIESQSNQYGKFSTSYTKVNAFLKKKIQKIYLWLFWSQLKTEILFPFKGEILE